MSLKNLCFFDCLPSSRTYPINHQITFIILYGLLFVLALSLMGFAFMEFEYDEFPSIEARTATWGKGHFRVESFLLGIQMGVFAAILVFEYLRSHIGEKRFADLLVRLAKSTSRARFPMTALFHRAVVFVFYGVNRLANGSRLLPIYSISFKNLASRSYLL